MRVTGVSGELLAGWHKAAALGPWEIQGDSAASYRLSAEILSEDPYWSEHRPLDISLHLSDSVAWVWRSATFRKTGNMLTATVAQRPDVTQRVNQER